MAEKKRKAKLTEKQLRFCKEYVIDLNGTQAVIRAGYSKNGADVQAIRLLGDARIKDKIGKLIEKTSTKLELTAETVLKNIEDVRKKAIKDKKYVSALKALELQGKYLKMFTDKTELTGINGGPVQITRIVRTYDDK